MAEVIVERLTTIPASEVSSKLEIEAEVASGPDRYNLLNFLENVAALGLIDKDVR